MQRAGSGLGAGRVVLSHGRVGLHDASLLLRARGWDSSRQLTPRARPSQWPVVGKQSGCGPSPGVPQPGGGQ